MGGSRASLAIVDEVRREDQPICIERGSAVDQQVNCLYSACWSDSECIRMSLRSHTAPSPFFSIRPRVVASRGTARASPHSESPRPSVYLSLIRLLSPQHGGTEPIQVINRELDVGSRAEMKLHERFAIDARPRRSRAKMAIRAIRSREMAVFVTGVKKRTLSCILGVCYDAHAFSLYNAQMYSLEGAECCPSS